MDSRSHLRLAISNRSHSLASHKPSLECLWAKSRAERNGPWTPSDSKLVEPSESLPSPCHPQRTSPKLFSPKCSGPWDSRNPLENLPKIPFRLDWWHFPKISSIVLCPVRCFSWNKKIGRIQHEICPLRWHK